MSAANQGTTMPRPPKPSELLIPPRSAPNGLSNSAASSPTTLHGVDMSVLETDFSKDFAASLTSLPPLPHSPPASPRHPEEVTHHPPGAKKELLTDHEERIGSRQGRDVDDEHRPGTSGMSKLYHLRRNVGSTPELSLVGSADSAHEAVMEGALTHSTSDPRAYMAPHHHEDTQSVRRKEKTFRNPLSRNKSLRRDSHSRSRPNMQDITEGAPKTVSSPTDWPGAEARHPGRAQDKRGKSAERGGANASEEQGPSMRFRSKPRDVRDEREAREGKSGFMANSKNVMSKAKTGGGMFLSRLGKLGRSGSNSGHAQEVSDQDYQFKIINLPLVEQTRLTRISKTLSECRDKTEYWMPSLPWRCIDFLNQKYDMEGLYRVPGSGPHVKSWQRRFDTEIDLDLWCEEVLDPNEIASMLKAWLRELPTEIMPGAEQKKLAIELENENPDFRNVGQPVSQLLRNALSELPPFNYYLLFAVTCHLSLLLANKELNRMDLNNLSVCVGPCLGLERWLFNYLVGDWRNCWQGCYTEKQALEMEKRLASTPHDDVDDYAVGDDRTASSGSSKPTSSNGDLRSVPTDLVETLRKPATAKPKPPPMLLSSKSYFNGRNHSSSRLGIENEVKRPSTADHRKASGAGLQTSSKSNLVAPTKSHSRSHSDLPATPIGTTTIDPDFMFPIQRPT